MAATRPAAETTAKRRALALLRAALSREEYRTLMTTGYLMVPSPSRPEVTYRIPRGPGFVRVFEAGQPVVDLCVQPTREMPPDDVVLMHKVLIESDEAAYLAAANRFPPRPERDAMMRAMRAHGRDGHPPHRRMIRRRDRGTEGPAQGIYDLREQRCTLSPRRRGLRGQPAPRRAL